MANDILAEDWSNYDNRKIRDNRDARFFSCEEKWERDFLKHKINRIYPRFRITQIEAAIELCCKSSPAPRPRRVFVECVLTILKG